MSKGRLPKLLELAKSLPEREQLKVAAVVGACVGDAAARPLHWVYDMSALNRYLKNDGHGTERTQARVPSSFGAPPKLLKEYFY